MAKASGKCVTLTLASEKGIVLVTHVAKNAAFCCDSLSKQTWIRAARCRIRAKCSDNGADFVSSLKLRHRSAHVTERRSKKDPDEKILSTHDEFHSPLYATSGRSISCDHLVKD